MVVLGQTGCIRAKWSKVVVFGQKWFYSGKIVVFVQSGCIRANWLYSGKSVCILTKVVVFGQGGCIRVRWLYSG